MPMLSLKSANNSSAIKFRKAKPNRLGGKLIGWWDFTDLSTLFQTVGGDAVGTDNDPIGQVLNKAYSTKWGRAGDNALGKYLYALTTARPLWKSTEGGIASFDNTNDEVTAISDLSKGGVGGDKLTDSSITLAAFTIFIVMKPGATSINSDDYVFRILTDNASEITLLIDNDGGTDTIQGLNANGSTRISKVVASGVATTNAQQLWTWVSNCDENGSTSKLYKNGDTSTGAGNQPGNSGAIDLTGTSDSNRVSLGGNGGGQSLYQGNVSEIMVYSAVLSDNEIKTIERYLTTKYGL